MKKVELGILCVFGMMNTNCKPSANDSGISGGGNSPNSLESVPAQEAEAIAKIRNLAVERLKRDTPPQERSAKRDAHVKHHGCVKAEFKVRNDLPDELKAGVLTANAAYNAWIRFSNGNGKSRDDAEGDGRGMAIKLTGVAGKKLLERETNAQTQDFLMINHPTFFVKNAQDYVDFSLRSVDGDLLKFFINISLNPSEFKFGPRLKEFSIARAIQSKKVGNPLKFQYWSMTPYLLGTSAIKFSAKPCTGADDKQGQGKDYLREAMRKTLSSESGCFDFMLQKQSNSHKMPVEDPTVEWDSKVSPFIKVATITIPPQSFESEKQMAFCENLSFTPWHSLPEHRPLGGINRVRKSVYEAISELRHQLNGVTPVEPTGMETF